MFSIRRRAQLNFYAYIPETDMTKPSDHDVQPIDRLVAEIFDTLDDTHKEAFLERAFYLKGADFNAKQIRTIPLNTVQTYQVLN